MTPSDRYFPATILGDRLHVAGVAEWGPWESSRLDWWPEDHLDLILPGGRYGEKVHTLEELEAALKEPMKFAPTRRVWIHEILGRRRATPMGRDAESRQGEPLRPVSHS
jgi:hypothetical protein